MTILSIVYSIYCVNLDTILMYFLADIVKMSDLNCDQTLERNGTDDADPEIATYFNERVQGTRDSLFSSIFSVYLKAFCNKWLVAKKVVISF